MLKISTINGLRNQMATINFSVPEDVKQAFNKTFAGENKSAVRTDLMRQAIEDRRRRRRRAARLAADLDHHLFDTLYHAVELERDATLLTADRKYVRKAGQVGHLVLLDAFVPDAGENPKVRA